MEEEGVSGSHNLISEEKSDRLYPMCFGASFAFLALRLLSGSDMNDEKVCEIRDKMLKGIAHLLGLLVWRIQKERTDGEKCELLRKLEKAHKEITELKQIRREDAKANEKVVSIFAMQEQSWFSERKKLRQHIGTLLNELRVLEMKKDETISELNEKLGDKEVSLQSKDRELEGVEQKRKDLEEKVKKAESVAEELRETAKCEAQEHSSELWKQKTAYIELVSSQRQLEAEMGRVLRQSEAAKQELYLVNEQKKESIAMVQKLSNEIMKIQKDLEQKDKILSAMLRKLKLDTAEKQMLLKEVKLSKAKRKQAQLETERWRAASESRHVRHSLRSMLSGHSNSRLEVSPGAKNMLPVIAAESSHIGRTKFQPSSTLLLEYVQPELRKEAIDFSPLSGHYSPDGNEELVITADVKRLEGWVQSEAGKYMSVAEQRYNAEIDAFVEQMRAKDEKLEASRWQLMSMELESKRLQSQIEGLIHDLSQARQESMKLEALLLDREEEMNSMKEQFALTLKPLSWPNDGIWSKFKIVKKNPRERKLETMTTLVEVYQEVENEKAKDEKQSKDIVLNLSEKESEEKDMAIEPIRIQQESVGSKEVDTVEKTLPTGQCSSRKMNISRKVDLHALGVTYKIKRLKQQLLMIERLTGKQGSGEDRESECNKHNGIKGFLELMSLLNRHVSRYQSLQEKTDDLGKRMHENNLDMSNGNSTTRRTKDEMKVLEHFLEETFQLQRYIVATGQKLMELQSKIVSAFVEVAEELERSASFDIKQFCDSVRTLFGEVQRGLQVQIARIIGDLEGTLACEGITRFRR